MMLRDLEELLVDEVSTAGIPSQSRRSPEVDDIVDSDIPAQRDGETITAEPALSERDQRILAFERQWWRHAGAKEQAIKDTFHLSATRYYQALNVLLNDPAALAADPVLVGRLRRLRHSRTRSRG